MIPITWALLLLIVGVVTILIAQFGLKKAQPRKVWTFLAIGVLIVGGLGYAQVIPQLNNPVSIPSGNTLTVGDTNTQGGVVNTYAPTAVYATRDKFSSTLPVTGTSYYALGTAPFQTSAYTAPAIGSTIAYWVSNNSGSAGTYWVAPLSQQVTNNNPQWLNTGINNGSATLSLFDTVTNKQINPGTGVSGTSNISLPANGQANVKLVFQGTAKKSCVPFGGDFVVEYNSTVASVTCTGDGLTGQPTPYHTTYTVGNVQNTYTKFTFDSTLDDQTGNVKTIYCQFKNGGQAMPTASAYNFTFIPANYYLTQSGQILLDTEKSADALTTRTGSQTCLPTVASYWA